MALLQLVSVALLSFALHGTLGAIPLRPELPKTYTFTAQLQYFGGFAEAEASNDFETGSNFQGVSLSCGVQSILITRYDLGKIFAITRLGTLDLCISIPSPAVKPVIGDWDWLEIAEYSGVSTKLTGEPLDIWTSNLTERIELGVTPERPNIPEAVLYDGGAPAKQNFYRVFGFSGTTPPATVFEVPAACPAFHELENIHPLKLLSKLMTPYQGGRVFKTMPGYSQL